MWFCSRMSRKGGGVLNMSMMRIWGHILPIFKVCLEWSCVLKQESCKGINILHVIMVYSLLPG